MTHPRSALRALTGIALCTAGLLAAEPLSPAGAADDPRQVVEQAPVLTTDVRDRPQGVAARYTAATGSPPQIAYSVAQFSRSALASAVVRLNPLTGQARTVVATRGPVLTVDAWSVGRARIYYGISGVTATGNAFRQDVDSVPQAGGAARRERTSAYDLDVSRDAARLVYTRQEGGASNLFISDVTGRNERRLTGAGGFAPRLSPDGRLVVFTRNVPRPGSPGPQAEVFTVRTDGTGLARVTRLPDSQDISGAFSPDSRRLLITRLSSTSNRLDVYSIGIDGRGLRLVRAGAGSPDWAANGWITYLTRDRGASLPQVAVRAPGLRGAETVLTRERSAVTALRFAR